jgi:hypothetical protein
MLPARRSRPLNNQSTFPCNAAVDNHVLAAFTKLSRPYKVVVVVGNGTWQISRRNLPVVCNMSTFALQPTPTPSMYAHAIADTYASAVQASRFEPAAVTPFGSSSVPFNLPLFAKGANSLSDNAPSVDVVRSTDERWRAHERVDNHMFIRMIRRNYRQCLN